MPQVEIEASRLVRYSIMREISQAQADAFREVCESGDKQAIQEFLEEWIDPRHDVVEADEYEVDNALLDGVLL